jgi:hypothetical protein
MLNYIYLDLEYASNVHVAYTLMDEVQTATSISEKFYIILIIISIKT